MAMKKISTVGDLIVMNVHTVMTDFGTAMKMASTAEALKDVLPVVLLVLTFMKI